MYASSPFAMIRGRTIAAAWRRHAARLKPKPPAAGRLGLACLGLVGLVSQSWAMAAVPSPNAKGPRRRFLSGLAGRVGLGSSAFFIWFAVSACRRAAKSRPSQPARSLTNGGFSSPTLCCGPRAPGRTGGATREGGEHGPYFNPHTFSKVISQRKNPLETGFSY